MNESVKYRSFDIVISGPEFDYELSDEFEGGVVSILYGNRDGIIGLNDGEIPSIDEAFIRKNLAFVWSELRNGYDTLLHFLRDNCWSVNCSATDILIRALEEEMTQGTVSDRFDCIELIYDAMGYRTLNTCAIGYCQGDYYDVLIYTQDKDADLEAYAKHFSAAMFEGSYGFEVQSFGFETSIDGCNGFIGDNHKRSGLLEYARDCIDRVVDRGVKYG